MDIPLLGKLLPRLSNAANNSLLWMAISGVLAAFGGRQGRRAASRGLLSIALTSFTVNLPGKLMTRRTRPVIDVVPEARRLARIPTSSSFPSGHSASALAFAKGTSIEMPALRVPLTALAGAVAFSRIYTGVHYPGDVVVGAGIGAAIAASTTKVWPRVPDDPPISRSLGHEIRAPASPTGKGLVIAVNPSAGPKLKDDPETRLRSAFPDARIVSADPGEGEELETVLEREGIEAEALGIAGGDGSVNAAATAAVRLDKPLLVIPAGTLNHLARDLGCSTVDDAVTAVKEGHAIALDVGSIADRVFLNTASFGNYVDLVDARERLEGTIGKWPAVLLAVVKVMRTSTPIEVEIDGQPMRVWMAFFGNCRYHPSGFAPSWRERLDDGMLDVRIVDATAPFARARLLISVLSGRLGRSRVYTQYTAREVTVRSLDGPLRLARDGETFTSDGSFVVKKLADPLAVYVPEFESAPRR
jgi:undecaprenyl-diphosphatase